tara:strand:+ start:992 stop:1360 length:369 start_codon:yes stop_codon:yes gene_type:complete
MKKVFLLLFIITITGNTSCGGAKALQNNFRVSEGMTKEQVIAIMGTPVASDFDKGVEEFHYCSTGFVDNFVAFFFKDGKVVSKTSYTVSSSDVGAGEFGNCKLFIKRGTYVVPDTVIQIRGL